MQELPIKSHQPSPPPPHKNERSRSKTDFFKIRLVVFLHKHKRSNTLRKWSFSKLCPKWRFLKTKIYRLRAKTELFKNDVIKWDSVHHIGHDIFSLLHTQRRIFYRFDFLFFFVFNRIHEYIAKRKDTYACGRKTVKRKTRIQNRGDGSPYTGCTGRLRPKGGTFVSSQYAKG